jgi:hypothetical protein
MKLRLACLAAFAAVATHASAATPAYQTLDQSSNALMDSATAKATWTAAVSPKFAKLYPAKRWGFVSEVSGGFTTSKTCVVTARAAMVPVSGGELVYKPKQAAVAFDALPNATEDQCKALAKAKLKEAVDGVMVGLVAPN